MSVYNHRPMVPTTVSTRINELLDSVKSEFEQVVQENAVVRLHRDDYEHKLNAQVQEMQNFQAMLYELQQNHVRARQQYEEEIMRLRKEIEARGGPSATTAGLVTATGPSQQAHPQLLQQQSSALPNLDASRRGQDDDMAAQQQHHSHLQTPIRHPSASSPAAGTLAGERKGLDTAGQVIPAMAQAQPQQSSMYQQSEWAVAYNPKLPRAALPVVSLVRSMRHDSVVCCVRFSAPSGRYLAIGCNRVARIYDTTTGDLTCELVDTAGGSAADALPLQDQYIRAVCFSPDAKSLATGAEDRLVRIWTLNTSLTGEVMTPNLSAKLAGHEQDIYALDYATRTLASGQPQTLLISGSGDGTARIWDVEAAQCLHVLRIPVSEDATRETGVTSVAASADARWVATGSLDRIVRIWDVNTGDCLASLDGHEDSVYSVAFISRGPTSPAEQYLITGALDRTMRLWQLPSKFSDASPNGGVVCLHTLAAHKDFVLSVAVTPKLVGTAEEMDMDVDVSSSLLDNRFLVSASKDRSIIFWDPRSGETQFVLQGHKNSVISVAVSQNGTMFASGGGDKFARIWSYEMPKRGAVVEELPAEATIQ